MGRQKESQIAVSEFSRDQGRDEACPHKHRAETANTSVVDVLGRFPDIRSVDGYDAFLPGCDCDAESKPRRRSSLAFIT